MEDHNVDIQNWRQDMRDYRCRNLSAAPELYRNPNFVTKVSNSQIKKMEYDFDPINNYFKDRSADETYKARFDRRPRTNRGQMSGCDYNIITLEENKVLPGKSRSAKNSFVLKTSKTVYKPMTNITTDSKNTNMSFFKKGRHSSPEKRRDFDIINNRYISDHETKTKSEINSIKENIRKKFIASCAIDPIRGVHYFPDKETQAVQSEKSKIEKMMRQKIFNLPLSYKQRDEISIGISKGSSVEQSQEGKTNIDIKEGMNYGKKHEIEKIIRRAGDENQDIQDKKCLNRYFARRFVEEYKNGVDPVSLKEVRAEELKLDYARGNTRPHFLAFPKTSKRITDYLKCRN
jgi:hypothetical protein